MSFQRNIRKPTENLHFSWFGAAQGRASESFFRVFSVLGALWSMSGRALATLGRSVSALGSSLAALGGHLAPNGSTRDPCLLAARCALAAGNSILDPQSFMLTAESRRPRAKCHRPWAFSETYENARKTFIFHGWALLGSMLRRVFFGIFRFWAPCGRRLGALWRLWAALCRLWNTLWRL